MCAVWWVSPVGFLDSSLEGDLEGVECRFRADGSACPAISGTGAKGTRYLIQEPHRGILVG